jgi:hypothetical protein
MMDEWMQKRIEFSRQYQANQEKAQNKAEIADKLWDIALVVLLIGFVANLIYGGIRHVIG